VQIRISARHGHVSDQTRAKISSKVEKLTRFFDRVNSIDVTIDLERREGVSVDLKVSAKQKDLLATDRSENLMTAVDNVVEKMEQQLRKYKQKIQERHRAPGHRQKGASEGLTP
jgi:putative sigma-54 modulation protein